MPFLFPLNQWIHFKSFVINSVPVHWSFGSHGLKRFILDVSLGNWFSSCVLLDVGEKYEHRPADLDAFVERRNNLKKKWRRSDHCRICIFIPAGLYILCVWDANKIMKHFYEINARTVSHIERYNVGKLYGISWNDYLFKATCINTDNSETFSPDSFRENDSLWWPTSDESARPPSVKFWNSACRETRYGINIRWLKYRIEYSGETYLLYGHRLLINLFAWINPNSLNWCNVSI